VHLLSAMQKETVQKVKGYIAQVQQEDSLGLTAAICKHSNMLTATQLRC